MSRAIVPLSELLSFLKTVSPLRQKYSYRGDSLTVSCTENSLEFQSTLEGGNAVVFTMQAKACVTKETVACVETVSLVKAIETLNKSLSAKERKTAFVEFIIKDVTTAVVSLVSEGSLVGEGDCGISLTVASPFQIKWIQESKVDGTLLSTDSSSIVVSEFILNRDSFLSAAQRVYAVCGEQNKFRKEGTTVAYIQVPTALQSVISLVSTNGTALCRVDAKVLPIKITSEEVSYVMLDAEALYGITRLLFLCVDNTVHCIVREDKSIEVRVGAGDNSLVSKIAYAEQYDDLWETFLSKFFKEDALEVHGEFKVESDLLFKGIDLSATRKKDYRADCYFNALEALWVDPSQQALRVIHKTDRDYHTQSHRATEEVLCKVDTSLTVLEKCARVGFHFDLLRMWFDVQKFAEGNKRISVQVCSRVGTQGVLWYCSYTDHEGLRSGVYLYPHSVVQDKIHFKERCGSVLFQSDLLRL
jgi:hypothetical protein